MFVWEVSIGMDMGMAVHMELFIQLDLPLIHGIYGRCRLRQKIEFMGYYDIRKIQIGKRFRKP